MSDADIENPSPGDQEARPGGAPVVKPNLGPAVSADVQAVLDDMEQARALAAEYQKALASKSHEFAELKQAFERTQRNLEQNRVPSAGGPLAKRLNLSPVAAAEVEALLNDMEQAREMAADYQSALSSKSNEFAELKQVFEKTKRDLAQLQKSVTELREERHRLANEAMRADALELRVQKVTREKELIAAELERLRRNRAAPGALNPGGPGAEQAGDATGGADGGHRPEAEVDRDFIHIAYKKDGDASETVEQVKTGTEMPRRSVRTLRTY